MMKASTLSQRTRRLGVAEAKGKLSEVLRDAAQGPTVIHCRGRDLAVVLAVEEYERLLAGQQAPKAGGAAFLHRVEVLKQRYGGSAGDFEPRRLEFVPSEIHHGRRQRYNSRR